MANPQDITTRLVTMAATISGINGADDELPASLTDTALPFLLVVEGGANFTSIDVDTLSCTREWTLLLWVKAYEQGSVTSEKAARDACLPFLLSVPRFFWGRRTLEHGDTGVAYVTDARLTRDEGAQGLTHNQRYFYGIPYRLSVTYLDDL